MYADYVENYDMSDYIKRFYDVDISQCRRVFSGDLDLHDEEFEFFSSTKTFIRNMNLIQMAKELQSLGASRLAELASTATHTLILALPRFDTTVLLKRNYASEEAKAATLDCPYCLSVFSRPDLRRRHVESCSSRPSFKGSSTSKKRDQPGEGAKDGHNKGSAIGSLADATDSGPKNYYNLDEKEALRLPRRSATNGGIYRGEVYCRMPGCRDTTRFRHITYLRKHYRRKHDQEWAADKNSITGVGKLKHGKGLQGCSGNLVKLFKWN